MFLNIIFCFVAYLIGSLSAAVIVSRLLGLPDPRTEGSKNPGATNVLRIGGKKAAVFTLLGDALKGTIPVTLAMAFDPNPVFVGWVMLAALLGHLYPIFFDFKGGKGVATAIGALFGLSWLVGWLWLATWLVTFYFFRISSLAALTASLLAPLYAYFILNIHYAFFVALMTIILFWRHKANIERLLNGTEPKLKFNGKEND
jgi:glycerol-3-phosphate acyltransferase PlsY